MPIRINLLSEALAEAELRRRDPVKRAIFLGAFLVALSLVWFSSVCLTFMLNKQDYNRVEAGIQSHTNAYAQVQTNLKKVAEVQNRIAGLNRLTAARFLQGNLLDALQHTYVPNVQLTHLRVDQAYSATAGTPAKTNQFGVVAARPPTVTEHITLTLDAKDFSPNPGDQVNHFKDALLKLDYFKPLIDPAKGIRLSRLSPLQTGTDNSKPFVMFTLECRFLDRTP